MRKTFLLRICCCLQIVAQVRAYKAVVVEYAPTGSVFSQTPAEVLNGNLVRYGQFIIQAAETKADIIVFPEYGLTTLTLSSLSRTRARPFLQLLPSLNTTVAVCNQGNNETINVDQLVFTSLSCFAQQYAVYVVANLGEIVTCDPGQIIADNGLCPEDGAFQYNTNIVIDRDGQLIARYRKTTLFLEPPFQEPMVVDHTTFATDFGVEFGVLTCFDIMFFEPALTLYYERGIRDFVFPTAWVDELPFLTAAQVQEGWSRFLGVNLLASGYHLPANGQLGSGVYGPLGPFNYTFSPDSGTKPIIASTNLDELSEKDNTSTFQQDRWMEPHGMLYEDLSGYSNIKLDTGEGQAVTLCHDNLCCSLNYSSYCPEYPCDQYRLLAYSGQRTLGGGMYTISIQLCGVVGCTNDSIESCARSDVNRTESINELQLRGNFSSAQLVMPTAINTELQLSPFGSTQLAIEDDYIQLNITRTLSDILAIGLYGRIF